MCSSVSGQKREIENRDALFRKIGGKSYPGTTAGIMSDKKKYQPIVNLKDLQVIKRLTMNV